MAFTERIRIVIDVAGDTATRGLRDFSTSVREADGITGRFKAGIGSLGDSFRSLGPAGQAGLAAGGISAVGLAAYSAVDKFADLGIEVGKFADATGMSAEESSRWIEVVGDLGVESGSLSTALNKLNKEIDPGRFEELGIAIAKTKDGATDVNGTFLNVIDRLNGMQDPAEKARVASELLGKGWQDMAEVVEAGSSSLKQSLAEVSDVKVFDDDKVAKARKFREMMDNLNDVTEDLSLAIGESLLPAIVSIGTTAADTARMLEPLLGGLTDIGLFQPNPNNPFKKWNDSIDLLTGDNIVNLSNGLDMTGLAAADAAHDLDLATDATDDLADSSKALTDDLKASAEAHRDAAAAAQEQLDAYRSAADATFGLRDAQEEADEKMVALAGTMLDSESTLGDLRDALNDVRDSAVEVADGTVRLSDEQAVAEGRTRSAKERLDEWNAAMLRQANTALPEAKTAIGEYIAEANAVPPSKMTEFLAAVRDGDLLTVNQMLTDAAAARDVALTVDAQTAQADADMAAWRAANDRLTVRVTAATASAAIQAWMNPPGRAAGGPVRAGEPYIVGERGRELMVPGVDGTVIPANETRALMNGSGGSAVGGGVVIKSLVIQNTGPALDERALAEGIARARRKGYM